MSWIRPVTGWSSGVVRIGSVGFLGKTKSWSGGLMDSVGVAGARLAIIA